MKKMKKIIDKLFYGFSTDKQKMNIIGKQLDVMVKNQTCPHVWNTPMKWFDLEFDGKILNQNNEVLHDIHKIRIHMYKCLRCGKYKLNKEFNFQMFLNSLGASYTLSADQGLAKFSTCSTSYVPATVVDKNLNKVTPEELLDMLDKEVIKSEKKYELDPHAET